MFLILPILRKTLKKKFLTFPHMPKYKKKKLEKVYMSLI